MSGFKTGENLVFQAVIFDLDGVVTNTALTHATSWKAMFDEYLQMRAEKKGESFKPFDYERDYLPYVDGKPRYKGVKSFLESRGIELPFGVSSDEEEKETICGLGNRKNIKFREILASQGTKIYPFAIQLIEDLLQQGIHTAVASSSKNCQFVLQSAKIEHLFETRVDGIVSEELDLNGKPEADIFIKAAENVGCNPSVSVVVEDAVSGVQAGVKGGFGLIIGVARENNGEELKKNGADIIVESFEGVKTETINKWFIQKNKG